MSITDRLMEMLEQAGRGGAIEPRPEAVNRAVDLAIAATLPPRNSFQGIGDNSGLNRRDPSGVDLKHQKKENKMTRSGLAEQLNGASHELDPALLSLAMTNVSSKRSGSAEVLKIAAEMESRGINVAGCCAVLTVLMLGIRALETGAPGNLIPIVALDRLFLPANDSRTRDQIVEAALNADGRDALALHMMLAMRDPETGEITHLVDFLPVGLVQNKLTTYDSSASGEQMLHLCRALTGGESPEAKARFLTRLAAAIEDCGLPYTAEEVLAAFTKVYLQPGLYLNLGNQLKEAGDLQVVLAQNLKLE